MNNEFRNGVQDAAKEALHIVKGYFMGDDAKKDRVNFALKAVGFGVKVEHMDQMKVHGDKSLALRLLPFLKDEDSRNKYIKITNPDIQHLIISRPVSGPTKKRKELPNGR